MDKIIFKTPKNPKLALYLVKQCMEEVLDIKSIKGISLRNILQELLPQFSINCIRVNAIGDIVLEEYLYNAIEFGTLKIPRFQIISKTKRRIGRRPQWQIHL